MKMKENRMVSDGEKKPSTACGEVSGDGLDKPPC
jgi:hypothetical protein